MRFCVIAYRMNSKKTPSSIMRARTAPYIHAHRALSCRRRIERSDVLPEKRQQILPADAHHVERRTVLGKYRRFVIALHKSRKRPALQKQTYRAFSKQTIDSQGATTDLIADDPYKDNLARLYKIKQRCVHERNRKNRQKQPVRNIRANNEQSGSVHAKQEAKQIARKIHKSATTHQQNTQTRARQTNSKAEGTSDNAATRRAQTKGKIPAKNTVKNDVSRETTAFCPNCRADNVACHGCLLC